MRKIATSLFIVTVLTLTFLACGGSSTDSNSTAIPSDEQGASGPTGGENAGITVEQGGYALTVIGIEDPATPGANHNPSPGTRLIAVEIIVRNNEGVRTMKLDPLNASLFDTTGAKYSADLHALDDLIARRDLAAGDEERGKVGFNIRTAATPARFDFEFVFGNKVQVDLTDLISD